MREGMDQPGQRPLTATAMYRELVLCSSNNAHTLRNPHQ